MMCGESCGDGSIPNAGEIRPSEDKMHPAPPCGFAEKTKEPKILEGRKNKRL